ncbi:MAG TPA: tetratricopeptide repeat protein [Sulfurimonas sp.]|nr:tetratricopeptide repeat protein [Sulfurimonas sp.]
MVGLKAEDLLQRFTLMFFPFFIFTSYLYALNMSINVGKEKGEFYSAIHIKEDFAFKCISEKNVEDEIKQIQCVFPREAKEKFEKIKTDFFIIDSFRKNKKYYVRILPLKKMKLIPISSKLYEKNTLRSFSLYKEAKHWMILAYEDRLPFINIEKRPTLGLAFPLNMNEIKMPSVGALDISGTPIRLDQVKDVRDYMRIKTAYKAGNYDDLAEDVDALFSRFPNTIFKAELLLYKMRGFHLSDESEALIEVSKEFIREYSDSENMGEVLAYTANAYSAAGMQGDGFYLYERLFTEFPNSKYAALGMVFLGQQFSEGGKLNKAEEYLEKALYLSNDVEIASMAAIRLAKMSLDQGNLDRSSELYTKIIEGNEEYLLHDVAQNYDNARTFSGRRYKKMGADILIAITNHLSKADDQYEYMLKDIGLWLAETDDKAAAFKALKSYQIRYDESEYAQEIQEALDSLFYIPDDANTTALLAEYDALQNKYKNEEIGNKAALQTTKLLFNNKEYQAVIDMEGSGAETEEGYYELKKKAASVLVLNELENKKCSSAISLRQEHNVSIDTQFDNSLYICAFRTGNYVLAKKTVEGHLKDKIQRLMWLYRYAKTLNKMGEYEELVKVSSDVMILSDLDKTSKYDDILQDTFRAYERLKDTEGMITTIQELEKRRGLEFDDIELYVSMVKLGLKERDDIMIQSYAKKVMSLQDKTSSYSQSPFVEFAALQVLKAQKKDKELLTLLNTLEKRNLSDKEKSRVQYMFGSLLMKEAKYKEAKASFEESIRADDKSAWAGLSRDALKLL